MALNALFFGEMFLFLLFRGVLRATIAISGSGQHNFNILIFSNNNFIKSFHPKEIITSTHTNDPIKILQHNLKHEDTDQQI